MLRIIRLVRDLPPAKREAEVARLAQLSLHEIKRLKTIVPRTPPVDRPVPRAEARKPIGQRWHDQMVEIRQHLMGLERNSLIENLVRTWSPPVRQGYCKELGQVIAALHLLVERFDNVDEGPTPARVLHLAELSRPQTRQSASERGMD